MSNIVKLFFQAVAQGSGFSKLYGEVKGLAGAMPGLTKATMILGQAFGSVGASVGRMATMLLQGGIWGAAAEGIRFVVDQLGIFKDKSAEAKEKLDELKKATDDYYKAISESYEKAKVKIDKETETRKAQIEITNRMIKAELELRRAKALSGGDVGTANAVQEEIEKQDGRSAVDKSEADVKRALINTKNAESNLRKVLEKSEEARLRVEKAERKAEQSRAEQARIMTANAFARGSYVTYNASDFYPGKTESEELKAAYVLRDEAKKQLSVAQAAVAEERKKLQLARQSLDVLKKEQEAAEAKARAEKEAAEANQKAEAKKAQEDANKKFLQDAKAAQIKYENEERERKKRQAEEEAAEKKRKLREFEAERLREEIRTNRATASNYEQALSDAIQRAADARDVLGNAANMDQGNELAAKRQQDITDKRFAARAKSLQARLDEAGGDVTKLGRLSNLDRAVYDRMTAEKERDTASDQLKKLNDSFDKLAQELKEHDQL